MTKSESYTVLKPANPLLVNTILYWIYYPSIPLYMLLAIIGDEGFNFMWAFLSAFMMFTLFINNHAVRDTRRSQAYARYLIDSELYEAFFNNGSLKNVTSKPNLHFNNYDAYVEQFVTRAMDFYDNPKFNKRAYLEYQLQKKDNDE